jgi:hypothetical protein
VLHLAGQTTLEFRLSGHTAFKLRFKRLYCFEAYHRANFDDVLPHKIVNACFSMPCNSEINKKVLLKCGMSEQTKTT